MSNDNYDNRRKTFEKWEILYGFRKSYINKLIFSGFISISILLLIPIVKGELDQETNWSKAQSFHEFHASNVEGNEVSMEKYKGHVVSVSNVATQGCAVSAKTLKILQTLQDRYSESDGLKVAIFVVDGMVKSSGTNEEIKEFFKNQGSTYDVYGKIESGGDNAHPIFKWLGAQAGLDKVPIATKFLIGKDGQFLTKIDFNAKADIVENTLKQYLI